MARSRQFPDTLEESLLSKYLLHNLFGNLLKSKAGTLFNGFDVCIVKLYENDMLLHRSDALSLDVHVHISTTL